MIAYVKRLRGIYRVIFTEGECPFEKGFEFPADQYKQYENQGISFRRIR